MKMNLTSLNLKAQKSDINNLLVVPFVLRHLVKAIGLSQKSLA